MLNSLRSGKLHKTQSKKLAIDELQFCIIVYLTLAIISADCAEILSWCFWNEQFPILQISSDRFFVYLERMSRLLAEYSWKQQFLLINIRHESLSQLCPVLETFVTLNTSPWPSATSAYLFKTALTSSGGPLPWPASLIFYTSSNCNVGSWLNRGLAHSQRYWKMSIQRILLISLFPCIEVWYFLALHHLNITCQRFFCTSFITHVWMFFVCSFHGPLLSVWIQARQMPVLVEVLQSGFLQVASLYVIFSPLHSIFIRTFTSWSFLDFLDPWFGSDLACQCSLSLPY